MKPTPSDWPRLSSALYYQDPAAAIDWLCDAFGFEVRIKVEGDAGEILHSELTFGEAVIMVSGEGGWSSMPDKPFAKSPKSLDGVNTQSLMLYVDDAQAHFERAKAAGAAILKEPEVTDYGPEHWADRAYACDDPEGHRWYFAERVRNAGEP